MEPLWFNGRLQPRLVGSGAPAPRWASGQALVERDEASQRRAVCRSQTSPAREDQPDLPTWRFLAACLRHSSTNGATVGGAERSRSDTAQIVRKGALAGLNRRQ